MDSGLVDRGFCPNPAAGKLSSYPNEAFHRFAMQRGMF